MAWTRAPIGFAMLTLILLAAPPAVAANPTTAEVCSLSNVTCARGTLSGSTPSCTGNSTVWTCHVDWTLIVVTRGPQSCGRATSAGPTVGVFCAVLGNTASSTTRLSYVNKGTADLSGTVCSSALGSVGETCMSIPVASVPLPPPPPPPGGGCGGGGHSQANGPTGKAGGGGVGGGGGGGAGNGVGYNGGGRPCPPGPRTGADNRDSLVAMGLAYLP